MPLLRRSLYERQRYAICVTVATSLTGLPMRAFEEVFGVPPEHMLREVRRARSRRAAGEDDEGEHEERDGSGTLVAVYESWTRLDGDGRHILAGFVKYSPSGWVLARSDGVPRPEWRMGTALWPSRP